MAEDREVLRSIWDGRLPVCFNLSSDEVVTVEQPDPYYVSSHHINIPCCVVNLCCRRKARLNMQDFLEDCSSSKLNTLCPVAECRK